MNKYKKSPVTLENGRETGEGLELKADCPTSGLADILLFKSQPLSIFILFSLLSMNPAKVLLNFPLLSMKKHLPFARILIVRTETLLAAGAAANSRTR